MSPNPADFKPCSAEEIKAYRRMILAENIERLKEAKCPDCNSNSLRFTGQLFDLDAAFIECERCDYESWILLKGTGLPSEACRHLMDNNECSRTSRKCDYLASDLRDCRLFKEAISASHRARMLLASSNG